MIKDRDPSESPEDAKKRHEFHASAPMQAANNLRKTLTIDEESYRLVIGHIHSDPRAYFLYGCMDEVFKVCTSSMRWAKLLDAPEEERKKLTESADPATRHIQRVVTEAVVDEQEMWARKLNEILADLILFAATNEQQYYRLYLACRQLDGYLGLQQDFEDFYACRSGNADSAICEIVRTIERSQAEVDQGKLWFMRGLISGAKLPRAGAVFRSARQRFMLAMDVADADQRLALGISYEMAHSRPSRSIHANVGGPMRENETRDLDSRIGRIGLSAAHITVTAHQLASIEPVGVAKQLTEAFQSSDAQMRMDSALMSDYSVGDIVTAYGPDVCEVIDKAKSSYGYTSYKVRYLSRPPLEELPEDWFPARYIHLLCARHKLREELVAIFRGTGVAPEQLRAIQEISEERLSETMREIMREWAREGILGQMLGAARRPRAGNLEG